MSPEKEHPHKRDHNQELPSENISRTSLKNQILAALQARSGVDSSEFVAQLSQDTKEALEQRISLQVPFNARRGFLEKSMTTWVDSMFDYFQDYMYKFNPTVRNMRVTCERPTVMQEVLSYNTWREPDKSGLLFKGWLSTHSWILIVRGTAESIAAYIVPGDRAISITRAQTDYRPYIELSSSWEKGKVTWTRDGVPISFETLEKISKELFIAFIQFTRGERKETEVMAGGQTAPPYPQQNPSHISQPSPYAEKFFAESGDLCVWPQPPEYTKQPAPNPKTRQALDLTVLQLAATGDQEKESAISCDPIRSADEVPISDFAPLLAPEPTPADPSDPNLLPSGESIASAFAGLIQSVEKELDKATKSGAKAFAAQDLVKAQQAFQETTKLNDFRQKVMSLLAEWASITKADQPPDTQ